MAVDTPHPQYRANLDDWRRMRDVIGGQRTMQNAGADYLRRPDALAVAEKAAEWRRYVDATPFFEATQRTVEGLVGLAFYRQPELSLPDSLKAFVDDCTQDGVPLRQFVESTFEDVLSVARSGVLVDMPPPDPTVRTVRDQEQSKRRPYLRRYPTENIVNWTVGLVGGAVVLTQVRLLEIDERADPADEFSVQTRDRIRVLELVSQPGGAWQYRQRVFVRGEWRDGDGNNVAQPTGEQRAAVTPPPSGTDESRWLLESTIVPKANGTALDYIPFWIVGPIDQVPDVKRPPLLGLANLNVAHYNTTGSYENALFWVGHPQPYASGVDPESTPSMRWGSSEIVLLKDASAKIGLTSLDARQIGALGERLKQLENQMSVLGARMLSTERSGQEAAETARIHRQGEISILARMAGSIGRVFQDICECVAEWTASGGEVKVALNTSFFDSLVTIDDIVKAVSLWQKGFMAPTDVLALMKQGELVSSERTLEEITAENQTSPIQPIFPGLTDGTGAPVDPTKPPPPPRKEGTLKAPPRKQPAVAEQ